MRRRIKKKFRYWAKLQGVDITAYDNYRFYGLLCRLVKKVQL